MKPVFAIGLLLIGASASADFGELENAAKAFLDSLSIEQRKAVSYGMRDDARATWSNLPTLMTSPAGVMLGNLTDVQRHRVHQMMQLSLSSQGYAKAQSIMWLDDILREIEQRNIDSGANDSAIARVLVKNRSSGNYAIAMFGDPGNGHWGWKISGHHLAVNISVVSGQIGMTPTFYGSNPRVIQEGPYAGFTPLSAERLLGLRFFNTLTDEQRDRAVIHKERPEDVIEGPGRRGSLKKFEGLSAKRLTVDQMQALQLLVMEYVRNGSAAIAGEHLDAIAAAGWKNLWFSWRGPTDGQKEFYYRVHGPRLLIEYNLQNPNHDHAVVRDVLNDYGEDWLGHHYAEEHPTLEEAMNTLRRAAGVE